MLKNKITMKYRKTSLFMLLMLFVTPLYAECELIFADGVEAAECAAVDSLLCLCEDFADGGTGLWDVVLNPQDAVVSNQNGELIIEPENNTLWFNDSNSLGLYKNVSGDFKVTSYLQAFSRTQAGQAPTELINLAGLSARNPITAGPCPGGSCENYVFIVLGEDVNDTSVESKTTVDSVSSFIGPQWPSAEGYLRLCRLGSVMTLLVREENGAWQQANQYMRSDFPNELQVGVVSYANSSPADLRAHLRFVDYQGITSMTECLQ